MWFFLQTESDVTVVFRSLLFYIFNAFLLKAVLQIKRESLSLLASQYFTPRLTSTHQSSRKSDNFSIEEFLIHPDARQNLQYFFGGWINHKSS